MELSEKKEVCPYKAKDTNYNHVFHYGEDILYCDNRACSNLDQSGIFLVEGLGAGVGICRTDGFVDENSELITKIKKSRSFKTLEAEKLEEEHRERLAEAARQFGK